VFAVVLSVVVVLYPEGGGAAASDNKNKQKGGRVGREGKLIMEWEFINSVTIQLAQIIVFQNFLCEEIKMKNAKYDDILNQ
jgi:hypothetical protein